MRNQSRRLTLPAALVASACAAPAFAGPIEVLYSNIPQSPTSLIPSTSFGLSGLRFRGRVSTGSCPGTTPVVITEGNAAGAFDRPVCSSDGKYWLLGCAVDADDASTSGTCPPQFTFNNDQLLLLVGPSGPSVIMREGSDFTGTGALVGERFGLLRVDYGVNRNGQFAWGATAQNVGSTSNQVVITGTSANNLSIYARRGVASPVVTGFSNGGTLDSVSISDSGQIAFRNLAMTPAPAAPLPAKTVLIRGNTIDAQTGSGVNSTPPGQSGGPFAYAAFNVPYRTTADGQHWGVLGILDAAAGTTRDLLVIDGVTVLQRGTGMPAGTNGFAPRIAQTNTNTSFIMGPSGDWMFRCVLDDGTGMVMVNRRQPIEQSRVFYTDTPIVPGSDTLWAASQTLASGFVAMAINAFGDYVISGITSGSADSNLTFVLNGERQLFTRGQTVSVPGTTPGSITLKSFRGGTDDLFLTPDGWLYFVATVQRVNTDFTTTDFQIMARTRAYCGLADVANLGGTPGRDGQLTADDLIVFLSDFFAQRRGGDVASLGGAIGPDGQWTPDDLIAFLSAFFAGCN